MIKHEMKDFPKVEGKPKPSEPTVWSVYLLEGRMRARLHVSGKFEQFAFDAEVLNPQVFADIVDAWRGK